MITPRVKLRWILLVGIVFWTLPAAEQFPEKFTNLKVLPKDISRAELQSTMRGFAFALNVRCEHCHVEKAGGKKFEMDFVADEKDAKKTARVMLEMIAICL
jgi:hypothetical protein